MHDGHYASGRHMKRIGTVEFELQLLSAELVSVEPYLEVSLDCSDCKRRLRTVVFDSPGTHGRCTPTGHEFKGSVSLISLRGSGAVAHFEYEYEPFTDAKYPDEKRYSGFERGAPTWVRFHFLVRCLECGSTRAESIQTNLVRPRKRVCNCGTALYLDEQVPRVGWTYEKE